MTSKPVSSIPVGTQFAPSLIDLKNFVQAVVSHSGDREALREAVWHPSVRIKPPGSELTRRVRSLPLEAAVQYGLLDEDYNATELTRRLAALSRPELYEAFAQHILLELGGLRILQGIEQMRRDNVKVTGKNLARYLTEQGFRVNIQNTAINSLRMWLAEAGLFSKQRANSWGINSIARNRLLGGFSGEQIALLSALSEEQRAFVYALCDLSPTEAVAANDVRDFAEARYGVHFDRGSLTPILEALKNIGLVQFKSGGAQGGKSALVEVTPLLREEVLRPLLERAIETLDPDVALHQQRNVEDIFNDLDNRDKNVKGSALEAFAVYIMRLLGLRLVGWRTRGRETGGAEIDALMAGVVGIMPTRWQVQCKHVNKPVPLNDVAKEVGLLPLSGATHILFVSTGGFSSEAVRYAQETMHHHGVTIFMLGPEELEVLRRHPARLTALLRQQAENIMQHRQAVAGSLWSM